MQCAWCWWNKGVDEWKYQVKADRFFYESITFDCTQTKNRGKKERKNKELISVHWCVLPWMWLHESTGAMEWNVHWNLSRKLSLSIWSIQDRLRIDLYSVRKRNVYRCRTMNTNGSAPLMTIMNCLQCLLVRMLCSSDNLICQPILIGSK